MSRRDPVQVLSKSDNGTLKLDERALKSVLECSWDKPTAIISICGDKRKGKSFLINLLLQNLTENIQDKIESTFLGKTLQPVFEWRGGPTRNTEGIWITSRPIDLPTKDGMIALYVMDTQGMFDNKTTKHECAQIFTLSTLMSSVLVFNLLRQLQSNDIEHLSFWTQSAHWVGNDQSSPVLQSLVLLVRDFPHKDMGYGFDAGKKYFAEEVGEAKGNEEVSSNLGDLEKMFRNVSTFAMPAPGSKIENRGNSVEPIKMKEIDKKFLKHSKDLFKQLKADTQPLHLGESPMTGRSLYDYIVKCGVHILTGKAPRPKDLSDHVADYWLGDLVTRIVEKYQSRMEKKVKKFSGEFDELQKMHENEIAQAITFFEESNKFGREAVIKDARDLLTTKIEEWFHAISRHVREKTAALKKEAELKALLMKMKQEYDNLAQKHSGEAKRAQELEDKVKQGEAENSRQLQLEMQRLQNPRPVEEVRDTTNVWIPFFYSKTTETVRRSDR